MLKLYAETILIGSQWCQQQILSIDAKGYIVAIESGLDASAKKLHGPVIPAMVNCHSHAFQRAFAGLSEYRSSTQSSNDSFWTWRDIMYRFVAKLSPQDVFHITRFAYLQMLQAGYGSVAEFHYLHHNVNGKPYDDAAEISHQVIEAALQTGIGLTHLPVLYSYAGFGQLPASEQQARFIHSSESYLALIDRLNRRYKMHPQINIGVALHSLRAVSAKQLKTLLPEAQQRLNKPPIHIHIAEQMQEVQDCIAYCGLRPVEYLYQNASVDSQWCLIHGTHLTASETTQIAKSGAVVGICPTTEANLGDGIFPAVDYLQQDGRFAIGSDSHIAINVSDELRSLEYSQRLLHQKRALLVGKKDKVSQQKSSVGQNLYLGAVRGGHQSIGQTSQGIAIGQKADLVVLDPKDPVLYAKRDHFILDAAIFNAPKLPLKDLYISGQPIIKEGQHPQQTEILENYRVVLEKLLS